MVTSDRGLLFWTPRVLTMAYIGFVSLFALDVFGGDLGFGQTLLALAMHLIPAFVLIALLVLAWRREWVGAMVFGALAAAFVLGPLQPPGVRYRPLAARMIIDLVIAGPVFAIAGLFLLGWLRRQRSSLPAEG